MASSSDYRKAYEAAKQELADLIAQQAQIVQRLVVVRQSIQTLATLCENEGIEVLPSDQAIALLEGSTLADEIRTVLSAHFGVPFLASGVRSELERLGHNLSHYNNPQSTIQMVLKRMVQSGEVEEMKTDEGKHAYAMVPPKWMEIARDAMARKSTVARRNNEKMEAAMRRGGLLKEPF